MIAKLPLELASFSSETGNIDEVSDLSQFGFYDRSVHRSTSILLKFVSTACDVALHIPSNGVSVDIRVDCLNCLRTARHSGTSPLHSPVYSRAILTLENSIEPHYHAGPSRAEMNRGKRLLMKFATLANSDPRRAYASTLTNLAHHPHSNQGHPERIRYKLCCRGEWLQNLRYSPENSLIRRRASLCYGSDGSQHLPNLE